MGYNTKNYGEQGGERTVIGGSLDVVSGGEIDIESGGSIKIGGIAITKTATEINEMTANAKQSNIVAITATDAATQGESYVQSDVQGIATLANANKAAVNNIITALIAAGIIADTE